MNCPGAEHDTEGSEISPPAAGLRCRIAQGSATLDPEKNACAFFRLLEAGEISPPAAGLRCRIAQELREEHEAILAMRSIAL